MLISKYTKYVSAICLVALVLSTGAVLAAGKRVAFVVGNGAYTAVPALTNPKNDAEAVSAALRKVGFEVVTAIDLNRTDFEKSVQTFVRSLSDAELSLFYYSGHGVEVGGENRIIPVDAKLATEAALEVETISLQTIMQQMRNNSRAQLLYLDACRDNPFAVKKFLVGAEDIKRSVGRGLAKEKADIGSLIAYATEPGNIALDGDTENSPFTSAVLRHSFAANIDVQSALLQVTRDVWESTNQKQRPWSNATLVEPIFLNGLLIKTSKVENTAAPEVAKIEPPAVAAVAPVAQPVPLEISAQPTTVGAGAQPLLSAKDIAAMLGADKVKLSKMPSTGTVSLEGQTLAEGAEFDAKALSALKFEPSITTTEAASSIQLEATTVEGKSTPVVVEEKVEVNACDVEAGEPLDLQGTQKGVLPNEINIDKALAACTAAVKSFPNVGRFIYQLGRAELAAKHTDIANALFDKAAEAGHIRAFNQMGYMAQRGLGRPQSIEEANVYFKQGAEKGDPYAMLTYGRNLARGRGVKQDVEKGVAYLNHAVEMGHTYAMNELGYMYMQGDPVKANAKRGVRFFEASMDRGDIYGIQNMANAYLTGKGVEKDPATALALYKAASEAGHPYAPTDIGAMYFNGDGVKKNLDEAIKWYEIGAERGSRTAASNLGWIYSEGPKPKRDIVRAVQFTALSAALDFFSQDKDIRVKLGQLPETAKSDAVKVLIKTIGADNVVTANSLDETLVLLTRKAWQLRNPRLDLF